MHYPSPQRTHKSLLPGVSFFGDMRPDLQITRKDTHEPLISKQVKMFEKKIALILYILAWGIGEMEFD